MTSGCDGPVAGRDRSARCARRWLAAHQEDETIQSDLLEPPQALGWIGFKDWAVQVRVMAKTKPGKPWSVMMALR